MDAIVKGQMFITAKKWAETQSEEKKKMFYQKVSPELLKRLENNYVGLVTPIEAKYYIEWVDVAIEVYGEDSIKKVSDFIAVENLSTFLKFLMKIGSPSYIASNFPKAHRLYFNQSEINIMKLNKKNLALELVNGEVYGKGMCIGLQSWVSKALEYSGAKKLQSSHSECKHKGQERCVFVFHWS